MKKRKYLGVGVALALAAMASAIPFPAAAADGWQQNSEGCWTYVQSDKKVTSQWVKWPDGSLRFVDGSGFLATSGWVNYQNNRYYVNSEGKRYENSWFSIITNPSQPSGKQTVTWYYAGSDGIILKDGWYKLDDGWYYFYPGGNSPRNTFFNIGDKRYYVDENGARKQEGWFSITSVNSAGLSYTNWYYADSDGALFRNGWHELQGKYYYFDANGNSPRKNWVNLDLNRYYVDAAGVRMQNGWFSMEGVNGNGQKYENWYYANPDGLIRRWGWNQIGEDWYYFDNNGLSYRSRWYIDDQKERYYLDADGVLKTKGWFSLTTGSLAANNLRTTWHYANENGVVYRDGFHKIAGKMYYFDANGTMMRNWWQNMPSGEKRYVGDNGVLYENEWFSISGVDGSCASYTRWYYAGNDGRIYQDGWYTIDEKKYRFKSGGEMVTGWNGTDDESNLYYCGEDGARRYGWQWLKIPDDWSDDNDAISNYINNYGEYAYFYFDPQSGKKKYSTSGIYRELHIKDEVYCFDSKGIMQMGWIPVKTTNPAIKGYRYYVPETYADALKKMGERLENTWMKLESPANIDSGFDQGRYYFSSDGEPVCGASGKYKIKKISGTPYAFDVYGNAAWGLLEIDNEFYYFGDSEKNCAGVTGRCSLTDGTDNKKSVYYFDSSGKGVTGIKNGFFYYKGKLQKADPDAGYEVFAVPETGLRLINASGKVMKQAKVKDREGEEWKTDASGVITQFGSDYVAPIVEPEALAIAPE
ncbi:hypothetical protein [Hungatella hathewayi]